MRLVPHHVELVPKASQEHVYRVELAFSFQALLASSAQLTATVVLPRVAFHALADFSLLQLNLAVLTAFCPAQLALQSRQPNVLHVLLVTVTMISRTHVRQQQHAQEHVRYVHWDTH